MRTAVNAAFSPLSPEPPRPAMRSSEVVLLSVYLYKIAPAFAVVFGASWRYRLDVSDNVCPGWLDFSPPTGRRDVRSAVRRVLAARPDFWHARRNIVASALAMRSKRLQIAEMRARISQLEQVVGHDF